MNKHAQSSLYKFTFDFICEKYQDGKTDTSQGTDTDESNEFDQKSAPSFYLDRVNYMGRLEVSFDQRMERPQNITDISEKEALFLRLAVDESNYVEELSDLAFTWSVESYQETGMII